MPAASTQALENLLVSGQLLSSTLELAELLTTVLRLSTEVVDSETASILLFDESTQELYFEIALGLGEAASKIRLPLGKGIAGSVALDRKPLIINDVRADKRWSPAMDKQSGFKTRSILAVPMLMRGRLIGVLEAINKKTGGFDEADQEHFSAFASQVSVAVENARLFASLREERFRLQTIFSQMTDPAILTDVLGRVLLANPAAAAYLGTDLNSLADVRDLKFSPKWPALVSKPDVVQTFELSREAPKRLALAGKATRVELTAPSGSVAPEPGWLLVLRDVTEDRLKEKLKRTFLSLISHKLKTPLAAIIGYSDILKQTVAGKSQDPMALKAVDSVGVQSRKLSDLVDKLLKYVNLEDNEFSPGAAPCPVDDVVQDAVTSLSKWLTEEKAAVDFKPCKLTVVADRTQLSEAVRNLIENGVRFDSKGKKVSVTAAKKDGEIQIVVSDKGPGIPPEEKKRIFEEFHQIEDSFTGQIHGWGLGLAFCKKVAERHGGRLLLESALGKGTTVTICLPAEGA
jgi:signal transduction histidine kinase